MNFKREECFRTRSEIIAFEPLNENEIIYALQHKTVKSFSTLACKTLKNIAIEHLGSQTTAISFHKSLELIAIANGKMIYIMSTTDKSVVQTIISYNGDVISLHFVQNSPYLICGTKNGRVILYKYTQKSSLSRLCSFPFNNPVGKKVIDKNYVGAIDSNEQYIASSGYGGAITIIKLHSLTHKQTIQSSRIRINVLKFISNELLLSAGIDGNIYFHDLKKYKNIKTLSSPIGIVSQILPIQKTHYALLNGEGNQLALLDTNEKKIVVNAFLKHPLDIKYVAVLDKITLFVVLQNNQVEKITLPSAENLDNLIAQNKYTEAFLLLERSPLLQNSAEHKKLDVIYQNSFSKAVNSFLNGHQKEALKLLEPFKELKDKKEDIDLIVASFNQYKKFHTLVLEKKYHVAYAISDKYPALQQTLSFKKMEEEFEKVFSFAQKQINIGRLDVAREILKIYSAVASKKVIVKLLIQQNKAFLLFLNSIKMKNYKNIALLIKEEPTFTQLPQYKELLNAIDKDLKTIRSLIEKAELDKAIEKIKELQFFPDIKEELKELYELANYTKTFLEFYNKDNFLKCYETIDRSKMLDQLELTKMLELHWCKLMDKCEDLALKGDLKGIKEALKELISLKSRSAKIGDIIRLSFQTKIKYLLSKRTFHKAEGIIYSYIDIFGLDTEVKTLMNTYEKHSKKKLAITIDQELYKERDSWMDAELIVGQYKTKT